MKLIVGLGNPGLKYQNNRHNVGFMFINYIINELASSPDFAKASSGERVSELKYDKKISLKLAKLSKLGIKNEEILLCMPQTFMNLSGKAVKKIIENCKLKVENLIVVHDDLDIPLGKFRIDMGRGPKLHNGLTSIEQHLKTKNFLRVRVGVDNRQITGPVNGETYVLQNFRPEEKEIINKLFPEIWSRINSL